MSIFIRILLVVGAIVLLAFMLRKIRLAKLKIEYTVFGLDFHVYLLLWEYFHKLCQLYRNFWDLNQRLIWYI